MFVNKFITIWLWTSLVVLPLSMGGCTSGLGDLSQNQPTTTDVRATETTVPPTDAPLPPTETLTPPPPTPTPTETTTITPSSTPTFTGTPTDTPVPPTPSGEDAIYVFYIQLDTGGPVSCGDSLIPANTGAWRSGDVEQDIANALQRLFFKREYIGSLFNPVYLSNMEVDSIDFKEYEGEVVVNLVGTYVRSGDRCDDSRVRAQIWTTIRQFPGIKIVKVLLNGNLLGDILATGK